MSTPDIPHDAIRANLAAILASPGFRASPRMRQLLSHLVEARLSGQERVKGWTVSVEVFGAPVDAPERNEGLVRWSMARLRQLLADYYAGERRDAPLRILISAGCHQPEFRPVTPPTLVDDANQPPLLLIEQPRRHGADAELDWLPRA